MKHLYTIVTILLNVLFCTALLWYFSRNAYLRPYAGSTMKEIIAGLFLIASLYANYFVLYPKLYKKHFFMYWVSVVASSLVAGCLEVAVGFSFIENWNAAIISEIGYFKYFSKILFCVFGRNIALNIIPFVIRNIRQLKKEADVKVHVVYQQTRMLDVCDNDNNCRLLDVCNIYYCIKNGNYVHLYTFDNTYYTRYCSLKYLEQLLGSKEFIRISCSILIPFKNIASYNEQEVVMKKMPWVAEPLTFKLDTKNHIQIATVIAEHLQMSKIEENTKGMEEVSAIIQTQRNHSIPPQQKLDEVCSYIQKHPGSRSTDITTHTNFSLSTVERCLSELRRQEQIEYVGSKKTGGYHLVKK
ncbi:MAG: LytTR family transcriptional regulator [Bacteroidales bacterium]|nr:LytTR family transcriptional regulator [Bacteroidales bacterium]